MIPSAVTMRAEIRLSEVVPQRRAAMPTPPPRVRPLIPTLGHEPPGTVRPRLASAAYMSISWTPAPIRAVRPRVLTDRWFSRERSTTRPLAIVEYPA